MTPSWISKTKEAGSSNDAVTSGCDGCISPRNQRTCYSATPSEAITKNEDFLSVNIATPQKSRSLGWWIRPAAWESHSGL